MTKIVTIRIESGLLEQLDSGAQAEGLSRSAFIKKQLQSVANAQGETRGRNKGRADDPKQRIAPRFTSRELSAIDEAASRIGVSRANFIRLAVRAVLWRGPESGKIVTTPAVKKWMVEIVSNLRAIGNNLNQGVRLLHVASDPDGDMDLERALNKFSRYTKEVAVQIAELDTAILTAMAAENEYWRPENVTIRV